MTIALVTGATRGLGFATARALARTGARVLLSGRNPADAERAADLLRRERLQVDALPLDVTDAASIAAAADAVSQLDVLVNNAGILPEARSAGGHRFVDVDLFRATFATNLFGAVAVTEAFLPLLLASAAGRIVNVSTTMGSLTDQADPDSPYYGVVMPPYQSSKAALNSVTIGLAKSLAGTGVVVTSVCPGFVRTDLTPVNREQAPLSPDEAAEIVLAAAILPATAASGTFVDRSGPVAW